MSQLEKLKLKLGYSLADTSKNDLLQMYLDDANDYILSQTHLDAIPTALLTTQIELSIIYYNKLGIEGQTAHSEGGISRSFGDVPESIQKKIRAYRKLPR